MPPRACPIAAAAAVACVLALAQCIYKGPLYGCPPEVPLPEVSDAGAWSGEVHVLMASDRGQFPGMLTALLSVARNIADPGTLTLHVVVGAEDMGPAAELLDCFRRELGAWEVREPRVELHEVRWPPFNITRFPTFMTADPGVDDNTWGYRKPWIWSKVYPHKYLPSVPRALWLDNDVVVTADLTPLFRMPMTKPFAAARDQEYTYDLNTGVVLYNMGVYQSEAVPQVLEAWLQEGWSDALVPGGRFGSRAFNEQTGFSELFGVGVEEARQAQFLDWRWNAVGVWNLWRGGSCLQEARILHFNGFPIKYWQFPYPSWTINRWKYDVLRRYAPRNCPALNWTLG